MTTNTDDYASAKVLHPDLAADIAARAPNVTVHFGIYRFLEDLAPKVEVEDTEVVASVLASGDVRLDLVHELRDLFSDEESGLDVGGDFTMWEHEPELVGLSASLVDAHQAGEDLLLRMEFTMDVPIGEMVDSSTSATVTARAWVDHGSGSIRLLAIDSIVRAA